jgi:hypothetical protein
MRRAVDASRTEGAHSKRTRGPRMAVGTDKRLARLAETLHVHRMADAVARPTVPDAEAAARRSQKQATITVSDGG